MSEVPMKVTIVEPDIAPSTPDGARLLGKYNIAIVPRRGEMVSLQTEVGGPRLPYRVMDVVYNMPDMGSLVGDDVSEQVLTEVTLIVCKIVTAADLARAAASTLAGRKPAHRYFPSGPNRRA